MMRIDPFMHMEEAWNLMANPFPADAIASGHGVYSEDVFQAELEEFYRKLIRGGLQGRGRSVSFLWSQGPGGDTGYGKTAMMYDVAHQVNTDFGATVLTRAGMQPSRIVPIAAVYANLNNLDASGLFPVLFGGTNYAATADADGKCILDGAWERITDAIESDEQEAIIRRVRSAWLKITPSALPLRGELVEAFASGKGEGVREVLVEVSTAARLRNGLQYLDFLLAVLAAADVNHLYFFVDQLEDLATNKSISSAKRSREIARIRDLAEMRPYAERVHFVFTFHNTAARALDQFWAVNRLPPYEILPENAASMVVLRGLASDEQVAELLRVYLESERQESLADDLLPFDASVLTILRTVSEGRVGMLLQRAHQLLNAAAERGLPRITGEYASQFFTGRLPSPEPATTADETITSGDVDDLLFG